MADKEIKIRFTVDDNGVVQKIDGVEKAIKKSGKAAEESTSGFSKFQAKLVTLSAALDIGQRAFSSIQSVLNVTFEALDRAATVENLARSFENLQDSIGDNATTKLKALQDATRGLVSDQELLQQSNQAVLLGVDDGSGKFEELAAAALKLGQAQGITAAQAIESLTVGIGRQSKQVLDNLGVIVKAEEAYSAYAAGIGKTTEQLTDQERRLAFNEAAFAAITEKAGDLSEAQLTGAQAAQVLTASFSNLQDRFATSLSSSDTLKTGLLQLNTSLNNIDVDAVAGALGGLIGVLGKVSSGVVDVINNFSRGFRTLTDFALGASDLSEESLKLGKRIVEITKTIEVNEETVRALDRMYGFFKKTLGDTNNLSQESEIAYKLVTQALDSYKKGLENTEKPQKALEDAVEDSNEELDDLYSTIRNLSGDRFDGSFGALENSVEDAYAAFAATGDLEDFREELEFLFATTSNSEEGLAALKAAIEKLPEATEKTLPELESFFQDLNNSSQSGGQNAANSFAVSFEQILTDGRLANTLADALFEGASGAETGAALGAQFGGAIGAAIATFFGADPAFGKFLGDVFGEKAGEELGRSLSDLFDKVFDNKSDEAANARENFFGFLREIIGRNEALVLIEDEFRPIGELFRELNRDIFDPEDGVVPIFENLFALAPEVQSAFFGVGEALTQLFDDAALDAGQVAALLAENLGGSLNNLQVLIQSLSISVGELEEAMIEAAKNGEISFLEAESALRQIGQLAETGIPGQIGAVSEAFDNLKKAGEQGGLFTIDALRDIGAEAAELGATSLVDLRQALEDAGVSAEDLNKFFESLAEVGISSVEELANITDRQAIQVLADLETIAFGFLETTNQAADDLVSRLENIPDQIESRIVIDVETRARDQGAQQVIDSGALGLTL